MLPKNTVKAMTVTFRTTLGDPQMHRIGSPGMSSKLEACFALEDTVGIRKLSLIWTQKENQQIAKEGDI